MSEPKRHSLRGKLITLVLTSLVLVGALTLLTVSFMQFRHVEAELALSQVGIRSALTSKGRMLSQNHALALTSLVADNAFNDVTKLVTDTVQHDTDVKYGLFLSAEKTPWVYVSPSTSNQKDTPRDAWRELQIPDSALQAKQPSERSVRLFGGEVLEFAAPIVVDEEYLGAIFYGISTEKMEAALQQARERSNEALKSMLQMLLIVVLVSTGIGLVLSARRATTIVKPVVDLTAAANAFASGDRSVTVKGIACGDEVEELADAFNGMVRDLNKSYESLENLNRTLEHKVEERTAELRHRNRDMALVLDNVDQGLITVSRDGIMAQERSRVVTAWFGNYGENTRFIDYIGKADPNFAMGFEINWESLISDVLPLELCLAQMPARLQTRGRHYSVNYTPINGEEGTLSGVLLVMVDVTEALAREVEEAEQRELLAVFSQLNRDRAGYLAFHRESSRMLEDLCSGALDAELSGFKRCVHTLKGNVGSMGLSLVAKLCHAIEDEMAETNALPREEALAPLRARWERINDTVLQLTGGERSTLAIREEDYRELVAQLSVLSSTRDTLRQVLSWQLEPISEPLRRLAERGVELARRLDKGEVEIELQADDIRVDPARWEPLWTALLHVVRNAVDHGLWPASEAPRDLGRRPRLSFSAHVVDARLVLGISDNGRGIQWDRVRAQALRMKLPATSRDDLVKALLSDNFTTASSLTEVSGRGVGMAAVQAAVAAFAGEITVASETGRGTTWSFAFPDSVLHEDLERVGAAVHSGLPAKGVRRSSLPSMLDA